MNKNIKKFHNSFFVLSFYIIFASEFYNYSNHMYYEKPNLILWNLFLF